MDYMEDGEEVLPVLSEDIQLQLLPYVAQHCYDEA